jgi:hypothetical protein
LPGAAGGFPEIAASGGEEMSPVAIAIIGIVVMLVLMFLRMPVGFAMGFAGFLGMAYFVSPKAAFHMLSADVWSQFCYSPLYSYGRDYFSFGDKYLAL